MSTDKPVPDVSPSAVDHDVSDPGVTLAHEEDDGRSPLAVLPEATAVLVALASGALLIISGLLAWSYDDRILGNLAVRFYPAGIQIFAMVTGVMIIVLALAQMRRVPWMNPARGLRGAAIATTLFVVLVIVAIAYQAGGLVNVYEGSWVALVGAVGALLASYSVPASTVDVRTWPRLNSFAEIGVVVVVVALFMLLAAYALGIEDAVSFFALLIVLGAVAAGAIGGGLAGWFGFMAQTHRPVFMTSALVVAFLFPFTQGGSDANMSIATQVLIFAATAMGLNIVVGLAGLLDLGYIAFLGAGAYVGAILSASAFATVDWKPPFIIVVICGALVSATLGLIIGSPTLRVSGDYLAIVTLAFGEIFRLAMGNLDGNNGPSLTNGPNGIPAIPDLNFFGFDFGQPHVVFGITLGRFANYYFLLLVVAALIILVFTRLNNSRIGRGWVAIREDEKAAEAMGVNVFGLKLFAFAGGAFLAGMAGTIKAHQDVSVTPDQYVFLESAFLLAAIVLGGMGTVAGVLIGATILKLLPEKLRFVADYRLLIFGLVLVLMMRFRPEGLIASQRRQLEFHEDDEELAELIQQEHVEEVEAK